MVHALAVHLSSYGCTWEVGRRLEKLEKHSASPRATKTLISCSPNFPGASIIPGGEVLPYISFTGDVPLERVWFSRV